MAAVTTGVPSEWARRSSTVQGLQGKGLEDEAEKGRVGAAL